MLTECSLVRHEIYSSSIDKASVSPQYGFALALTRHYYGALKLRGVDMKRLRAFIIDLALNLNSFRQDR